MDKNKTLTEAANDLIEHAMERGIPGRMIPFVEALRVAKNERKSESEAARLEIDSLKAKNLELERVCDATYVTQGADAYNHACSMMEQYQAEREAARKEVGTEGSLCDGISWLYTRIASLESQIEAVGAGGVEPLRKRCLHQISEPAQSQPVVAAPWQPIATAPEGHPVVVFWLEAEDVEHPERHEFDCLEDGVWQKHDDNYQHFCAVAPPGSCGPRELPPYTHWMPLTSPQDGATTPQPAAQALDSVRVFWQQHTQADALSMTISELHDDVELVIRAAHGDAQAAPSNGALAAPAQPLHVAATSCPHEIDKDKIVLHFDSKQPGKNALAQLAARLQAAQAQEDVPDMFWDADDTENFAHEIQDIIDGYGPGEIVTIECAKRLPNFRAVVTRDGDGISYEYLEAAIAAQQGEAT